ncbi:hypothetical protein C4565_00770 [Candidatus Parcubacteria bacterium]|nr:MAG: hypothetical protein C4565_00770 [Candidatus Parcubacteria bacterium]
MGFEDNFYEHMNNIDRYHHKQDEEFKRLCAEPCMKIPKPGDRVIVASGFLGMGLLWNRKEAEVLEVGETSVHVRFIDYYLVGEGKGKHKKWIHPALITDVLENKIDNSQEST